MLKMSDLEAAVAEGIISQDQAERLRDFSHRLSSTSDEIMEFSQDTRDEPFRLLRGFRDFFIAIGIAIFAVGLTAWFGSVSLVGYWLEPGETAYGMRAVAQSGGLVFVGIALAEWITRRQRLPLSSLVTALAFAIWSAGFLVAVAVLIRPDLISRVDVAHEILPWVYFLGAVLGLIAFYWRYRLPFTLLLLAGSAVGFTFFVLAATMGDQWTDLHGRILIGVLGLLVFAAAMWFDMKDPLRVKRFAECGFWLHLLAAPMLVHSLLLGQSDDAPNLGLILSTMTVLSLIALLIDRRALLVAGLSYLAVAIARIVSGSELVSGSEFAVTASVLGAAVLCLGLGWTPIRRGVMALVPSEELKSRLPPVAA